MKALQLIANNWRLLLAALTAAGVVHLWTTLTAVQSRETPAYARLIAGLPVNQISYLPELTPQNQKLPYMMPDIRYAICPYDASTGPVRIRATIPAAGWSLSLHTPDGGNFMFVPGTDERRSNVDLVLRATRTVLEARTVSTAQPATPTPEVKLSEATGVAIFRAPVGALAFRERIDRLLNSFKCFLERRRRR